MDWYGKVSVGYGPQPVEMTVKDLTVILFHASLYIIEKSVEFYRKRGFSIALAGFIATNS